MWDKGRVEGKTGLKARGSEEIKDNTEEPGSMPSGQRCGPLNWILVPETKNNSSHIES